MKKNNRISLKLIELFYKGLVFNLINCFTLSGMSENAFGNLSHFPLEILEMIVEHVPDKDETKLPKIKTSLTPLRQTCRTGRYLAQHLYFKKDIEGMGDPFSFVIHCGNTMLFNNLLYYNFGDIHNKPHDIQNLFFQAVVFEKPKMIDALVGLGAQVDGLNMKGQTALLWVLNRGYFRSFETLLSHNANVNIGAIIDGVYVTPLKLAQSKRDTIQDDPMRSTDAPCKEKYELAIERLKALGAQE